MFWKSVILYEIYSKKLQWPNTFCTSLYIMHNHQIQQYVTEKREKWNKCDNDVWSSLNYLSSNVLSLYCVFDVRNLVLCLTRLLIKFIDYKIMLKLQCKTTMKYTVKNYSDRILFARLCISCTISKFSNM
jgi:hypothetical protein